MVRPNKMAKPHTPMEDHPSGHAAMYLDYLSYPPTLVEAHASGWPAALECFFLVYAAPRHLFHLLVLFASSPTSLLPLLCIMVEEDLLPWMLVWISSSIAPGS
jgi:hypothetical protein